MKGGGAELEILCIDDGSTDSTSDILSTYINRYSFIRYFYKENGGQSSARNLGLKKAIGEYVWFVDSDDYIARDSIKKLSKYLYLTPDIITFRMKGVSELNIYESEERNYVAKYENGKECFSKESCNNGACWYWIKREFIQKKNLRFIEGHYCEDGMFTLNLFTLVNDIIYTDYDIYRYYKNTSSTTKKRNIMHQKKMCEDFLFTVEYLNQLYEENKKNSTSEYLNALRQRNFSYIFFLQARMIGVYKFKEARLILKTLKKINLYPYNWNSYDGFKFKILNKLFQIEPLFLMMILISSILSKQSKS